MNSIIKEKLAICYSCSGESYRESVFDKLNNLYFDDENIYYFIITDDKKYFDGIKRNNLIVNELKDFYNNFPLLEKNEAFLESVDKNDYAKKFVETNYLYSFSTMRFHLYQAYKEGISNVCMMCTDTNIDFNIFNNTFFDIKNTIYNAVSEWDANSKDSNISIISNYLKEKYNLFCEETVRVLDAAGRFFVFDTLENMNKFFILWDDVINHLYDKDYIKRFAGTYVYNDEYILAPIYNIFGLNKREVHCTSRMFSVKHNQIKERFWRLGGSNSGIIEHTNYEEFLKINNLNNG